ncbi:hypothetical protein BUE80_DR006423 [Diplocarpon rosae]|nr:hypothetical protein BUE80_DR006423 [Diplocarpon rosae]
MDVAAPSPSINSQAYTSVRRRDSTVNTRLFRADQEKEWTAARCHRLLRALTSRVAILQKDLIRFQSSGKDDSAEGKARSQQDRQPGNADWAKTKKNIRHTYSNRGRSDPVASKHGSQAAVPCKIRRSMNPGELTIPTPILARARNKMALAHPKAISISAFEVPNPDDFRVTKRSRGLRTRDAHFQPFENLRELRLRTTETRYTTYEGICNGLEALLRTTAGNGSEEKTKGKGAKSLLSMTLSAVPRYITQQESLLEAHMEETGSITALNKRDILTEIYDELECFGSSGRGWKQLRVIVRAHGVQIIKDAMVSGLLDEAFCGIVVAICINNFAMDEAQSLLSAHLSSKRYYGPKNFYDTPSRPISMLWKFTEFTRCTSFQFRELSRLLSTGFLPVQWLATKAFGPIWTAAIQLLSHDSINEDAIVFLDSALCLLSITRGTSGSANITILDAVKNTLSSLLTILTSIVILSRGTRSKCMADGSEVKARDDIVALLKGSLASNERSGLLDAQILLLLSNLFAQEDFLDNDDRNAFLVNLISCGLRQQGNGCGISPAYTQAVDFICQIARCCGRGSSTSGFEHLEHLHLLLESLASEKDGSNAVQGLMVDSAFAFAQKVPDRKHLDYASTMDARFCGRRMDVDTSLQEVPEEGGSEGVSGFRWEEGIGEWVTATPAVHVAKRKAAALKSFAQESECDTPYRPPPKLRRKDKAESVPVMLPSPPVASSPYFDDSIGVCLVQHSPSLQERELDRVSEDDDLESSDPSPIDSNDEVCGCSSRDELSSGSQDDRPHMEVSAVEDSFVSHGSMASIATTISKRRHSVDRVPRLNRKLLRSNQDWQLFEDSLVSNAPSASSRSGTDSPEQRESVDRAPRLGKRALRSSQTWQLFDESDDELSFLSASSHTDRALMEVTSVRKSNARRPAKLKATVAPKTRGASTVTLSDSEDELCI